MKNFSDVTAIDTSHALTVEIEYTRHGHCLGYVYLNDHMIVNGKAKVNLDLFEPIKLKVNLVEFTEGSSGIEITKLVVNGLNILPRYRHLANKDTTYIDFYNEWVLEIPSPFYNWYHQVSGQGWIA